MNSNISCYDRLKEVKEFDDSKMGVKGLIDSGITTIPRFFVQPPENLIHLHSTAKEKIPTVDLSGVDSHRRSEIVQQVRDASSEFGFFLIVNHGITIPVMEGVISATKEFHEQPMMAKAAHYRRTKGRGVSYNSNNDLFRSTAASWQDSLQLQVGEGVADWEQVPAICRKELMEWEQEVRDLGKVLMGLLSEGLGLGRKRLEEAGALDERRLIGRYYPFCPNPELTVGITPHTDPGFLTVLMQNEVEGLHVKVMEEWVLVNPPHGALVVNLGDLLQILSNDKYKSAEHAVLANSHKQPRVSIAVFFLSMMDDNSKCYGPLPELISPGSPPLYRNFTMPEYIQKLLSKAYASDNAKEFKL